MKNIENIKIAVTGTRGIPNILGGVETHCEELYPRLSDKGLDITVFRRSSYTQDDLKEYQGVKLYTLPNTKIKAFEAIMHTLAAIITAKFKLKTNIIHIHAIGPAMLTSFARLLGLKVVFTHHGPDYNRDKWGKIARFMLKWGERIGIKYANQVIVISSGINDFIQNKYKRNNAWLIPNGVPTPIFPKHYDYLDSIGLKKKQYIFAMGRFVPEKRFHLLIEAHKIIKRTYDIPLVIAGDTDFEDSYSKELKKNALKNGVILTGFIKGKKLQEILSQARLFVLPSSHEGLPIALLEAMSYRLPIIASDIKPNTEVGLPTHCYFKTDNTASLTEHLESALKRGETEVRYDMSRYNWDTIAEETYKVYQATIRQAKP